VKYDISYYCQYNEETKANEFYYNRIKLIWPRNYSYRIQCIDSHRFSGYYFPPIRKHVKEAEEKPRIKDDNEDNDIDNHNNDYSEDAVGSGTDKKEELEEGSLPEETRDAIEEKEDEDHHNPESADKLWTCIYRDMKKRNRPNEETAVFGKPTEETPSEAGKFQKKPKL
jgi:hypothetical protein